MFTTPRKAFIKLRAHPYLSPLKLFGVAETPTVTPLSSPGGHSVPPSSPFNSRISTTPSPRKRYGAYRGPWSSPLKPKSFRPVSKGYHRLRMRRTISSQSLRKRHSIRSLGKAKAARDFQFSGLSRAAFEAANRVPTPLTLEDRIFLEQLAKLGNNRKIITGLAEARDTADRAVELAPLINAEREAKAHASLAREKEQQQAFVAQKAAEAAAETAAEQEQLEKVTCETDELFMRQEPLFESRQQRQQEEALHRKQQEEFRDLRFQRFFQESRHNEELRQQAERDRLAHEQEARRYNEEVTRLREEREAFHKREQERIRLENERLAQETRDAQAFIDATLRFQQEAQARLQREQAARLQAEQQARAWFEAAQQAEMAANQARAQWNPCGSEGVDVSMMDASMYTEMDTSMRFDMDASMRTAAPYSPPSSPPPCSPPPSLTVSERFALYERKWAALKSDVPVLSFGLLPWPILHDASAPADITEERMIEFFYNPERPGYENKTLKERSRIELLRWHPDKFLGKVLRRVDEGHRAMVEEAIGQVTRFLVRSAAS